LTRYAIAPVAPPFAAQYALHHAAVTAQTRPGFPRHSRNSHILIFLVIILILLVIIAHIFPYLLSRYAHFGEFCLIEQQTENSNSNILL
jgi:hypothetical protein